MPSLRHFIISAAALLDVSACAHSNPISTGNGPVRQASTDIAPLSKAAPPMPDPRVGLKPGRTDAGEASWNMRLLSNTPTPAQFRSVNSDLGFFGKYAT